MFQETTLGTQEPIAHEPSVTNLVSGIVNDAQVLLRQQIALLKHEVRKDLRDARQMSISFVASCLVCGIAAVLLSFMLVHLVNWIWPAVPLWAGFGVIGAILTGIGGGLFFFAREKFEEIAPLSDEAREALKENLQWTTKPR
jgi:hypothetical protein